MTVRIVGFNLSHDSSAALIEDGRIHSALALERTTRIKRGTVPPHVYSAAMAHLTQDLLHGRGVTAAEVDYWIATSTESRDAEDEAHLADALGLTVPWDRRLVLPHPGHHLAHAAAAFYSSGFDEAAALVIDAYGSLSDGGRERESGFHWQVGREPERVWTARRPSRRIAGRMRDGALRVPRDLSGIGEIYRVVTLALGFSEAGTTYDDAGKTMGLAAYGHRFSEEDLFIRTDADGLHFDHAAETLIEFGFAQPDGEDLRLLPRPRNRAPERVHCDLAAQLQAEFESACLDQVHRLLERTGSRSLVLSGGCFLNSVANARIARESEVDRLFVFPAATDDGNAAGAALYAHHVLLGHGLRSGQAASPALRHVCLGPPRVAGHDVQALAARYRHPVRRHRGLAAAAQAAAAAIAAGEIVGWFQDRAEFGPRALGSRSILCHPGIPGMKDRLNARVKFREAFRPFAASVLAEHTAKWFDLPVAQSPFMLVVGSAIPEVRERIAEVVHVDGTCRLQTVEADYPGAYHALIEAFERETGLPLVLNTSFNLRGRPIVETPEQALDCLYGSRLDRLFIGEYELEAPDLGGLVPRRPDSADPQTSSPLLDYVDGVSTMREIAGRAGLTEQDAVDLALELRRHDVICWAGVPRLAPPRYPLPQYDSDTPQA